MTDGVQIEHLELGSGFAMGQQDDSFEEGLRFPRVGVLASGRDSDLGIMKTAEKYEVCRTVLSARLGLGGIII